MNESKFQFSNPQLEAMSFHVNESFNQEKFEGIAMESNIEIKMANTNEAYVYFDLHVGEETENQPFNIIMRMGAGFYWDETISEEKAKKMLNINAPAVLLSYMRPIISNITSNSKYPSLNIPFIDFTK